MNRIIEILLVFLFAEDVENVDSNENIRHAAINDNWQIAAILEVTSSDAEQTNCIKNAMLKENFLNARGNETILMKNSTIMMIAETETAIKIGINCPVIAIFVCVDPS